MNSYSAAAFPFVSGGRHVEGSIQRPYATSRPASSSLAPRGLARTVPSSRLGWAAAYFHVPSDVSTTSLPSCVVASTTGAGAGGSSTWVAVSGLGADVRIWG